MKLLEHELTEQIIGACLEVSNELGCGFLESVYRKALIIALNDKHLNALAHSPLDVIFRGISVGQFQTDIIVNSRVILEIKCVRCILVEHEAQLLNYLRATGVEVGLLINFGKPKLEWKRMVLEKTQFQVAQMQPRMNADERG